MKKKLAAAHIVGIGLVIFVCVAVPLAACKIFAASQPSEITILDDPAAYTTASSAGTTQSDIAITISETQAPKPNSAVPVTEEKTSASSAATSPAKTTEPPQTTTAAITATSRTTPTTVATEEYPPCPDDYYDDIYTFPSFSLDYDEEDIPTLDIDPSDLLN